MHFQYKLIVCKWTRLLTSSSFASFVAASEDIMKFLYIVLLCLVAVAAARNWYSFDLDDDDFYRPARRSWKAVGGWRAASAPSKRFYFDSDEDSDSYED